MINRNDPHSPYIWPFPFFPRVDRRQPFTLKVISDILNSANFNKITLFNVHSEVSEKLLRARNILPKDQINEIRGMHQGIKVISPDKGAFQWLNQIMTDVVECSKVRELQSGKLSGFKILKPELVKEKDVLIADDLCDGGGTFVGLAKELKAAGAQKILLYVSHGIFSKGLPLLGIDHIYTTNSYIDDFAIFPDFKQHVTVKNISWS
jgi:ribose-phosphate pyrophosphokinase